MIPKNIWFTEHVKTFMRFQFAGVKYSVVTCNSCENDGILQ